jgi:type IV secretion system protein VirB5
MKRIALSYLVISLFICVSPPAQAQGIPVYDASSFGQMVTQIEAMSKDYQKQLEQLDQAIKQANAITGPRNMGSLNNSSLESELRRYLPTTWEQTMHMMGAQGLRSAGLGTQNVYNSLTTTFQPLPGSEFLPSDPTGPIAQALDRRNNTTYAAMAASESAYNNISARIDTYENMLEELNNTTDLKASVDLQARIAAENGMILNELIRLQAMQIQQKAADDNETLTTYRRATAAHKYDASKADDAFKPQE